MNIVETPLIGHCGACDAWFPIDEASNVLLKHNAPDSANACQNSSMPPDDTLLGITTDEEAGIALAFIITDACNHKCVVPDADLLKSSTDDPFQKARLRIADALTTYAKTRQQKCVA